jgi:hypothetical protein
MIDSGTILPNLGLSGRLVARLGIQAESMEEKSSVVALQPQDPDDPFDA